jgi:hypothetical protein
MVEDVLKGAQKVIVDPTAKGVVPYLPLPQLGSLPAGAGPVKPVPSAGSGSSK